MDSMEIQEVINRLETAKSWENKIADCLLTPVRVLAGGHSYKIVNSDHVYDTTRTHGKVAEIAKKVLAVIGLVLGFPFVMIGLGLKALAMNGPDKALYNQLFAENRLIYVQEEIRKTPLHIPINEHIQKNRRKLKKIHLNQLVTKWMAIGKKRADYDEIRHALAEFVINAEIPSKFNYVPGRFQKEASELLVAQLRLVLMNFDKLSKDEQINALLELAEAGKKCPPTWLEVSAKIYKETCGYPGIEDKMRQYIQMIKEDILRFEIEKEGLINRDFHRYEWHVLEFARHMIGIKWGLDRTNLHLDNAYGLNRLTNVQKKHFKKRFDEMLYDQFTATKVSYSLKEKINKKVYDQELAPYFRRKLKERGMTDDEADEYIFDHFYDDSSVKLTEEGACAILEFMGIIQTSSNKK